MKYLKCFGLFILLLMFSNCDNDSKIMESYAILGNYDLALCPCCGGYIIFIEDDTVAYRFESLPDDSSITLPSENLEVEITYEIDRVCAEITYIILTKIEER